MKHKSHFALLFMLPVALASCGQVKGYADHLQDYAVDMDYRDGFTILQLSDIHWSYNTSTPASKRYLEKVIAETDKHVKATGGQIDLVELTGDQFMLANAYHVESFLNFFEEQATKYGFKYAAIWGNHDRHGLYNPNWIADKFRQAAHCFYIEEDDDLYGRSNFVINLKQGNDVKWQIANLDSGASFSETALSPFRDYDYIRKDQTQWWLAEHNLVGDKVPAIAYYHIPQQDNEILWKAVQNGAPNKNKFFKLEGFADNGTERGVSDFIPTAKQHNLKAAFMGHAHNIDWTVEDDDGLVLGVGVKTGPELYYAHILTDDPDPAVKKGLESTGINENFDLIGASLVTFRHQDEDNDGFEDGAFDLEHLYLNERASGDFVKWVNW